MFQSCHSYPFAAPLLFRCIEIISSLKFRLSTEVSGHWYSGTNNFEASWWYSHRDSSARTGVRRRDSTKCTPKLHDQHMCPNRWIVIVFLQRFKREMGEQFAMQNFGYEFENMDGKKLDNRANQKTKTRWKNTSAHSETQSRDASWFENDIVAIPIEGELEKDSCKRIAPARIRPAARQSLAVWTSWPRTRKATWTTENQNFEWKNIMSNKRNHGLSNCEQTNGQVQSNCWSGKTTEKMSRRKSKQNLTGTFHPNTHSEHVNGDLNHSISFWNARQAKRLHLITKI